jgi:hypothetical protein
MAVPPDRVTRKKDQIQIAVWVSRWLIEQIDARVSELQKGRLRKINRSDVVRDLLEREFGKDPTTEE